MKSILILSLLALSACASAPTYQPERARFGSVNVIGYADKKITKDTARVRYTHFDSNQAYALFLRRSAEITVAAGFSHFIVVDGKSGDEGLGGYMGINNSFARYEGTVKMLKSEQSGSFEASEILAVKVGAK